jgi:hypothetical protein
MLRDEIGKAFLGAHTKLYRDEIRIRKERAEGISLLAQHGITGDDLEDFIVELKPVPRPKRTKARRKSITRS